MRKTLGREGGFALEHSAALRAVRRVLLAWLAITGLSVGLYAIFLLTGGASNPLARLLLPVWAVYYPAWRLAYALGQGTDLPLFEFFGLVLLENLVLAVALTWLARLIRATRGAGGSSVTDGTSEPAQQAHRADGVS